MKKVLSLLLCLSLVLALSGCGAQQPNAPIESTPPEEDSAAESTALHFALGEPLTYDEQYTADDGTVLLDVSFELPQLELRTDSGTLYELPITANTADTQPREVAVRDKFNAEMAHEFDTRKENIKEILDMAREHYEMTEPEFLTYWSNYLEEFSIDECYLTDGLLSLRCTASSYYGGAHPYSGTYTRNFDLTSGEFLTLDLLDFAPSDITALGETLTHTLALYILDEIDEEGLASEYYEDYYSYIFDLAANANFYFTGEGMTVIFDAYVIAPYASGAQEFTVPYYVFYNALDSHTQSLLDVSQDAVVLADYKCAETLWRWFYLSATPMDFGTVGVNIDGEEYFRVSCGELNSLEGLRELVCTYVSDEIADEWLGTGCFAEANGALYASLVEYGGNMGLGGERLAVEWNGEADGTVVQTLSVQHFNETTGDYFLTGETESYEYPFTLADGHAVFTAFPCPL